MKRNLNLQVRSNKRYLIRKVNGVNKLGVFIEDGDHLGVEHGGRDLRDF